MAWNSPMKPETLARRARERRENSIKRYADLLADLRAKSEPENDPQGFWTEMYVESVARNEAARAAHEFPYDEL